MSKRERWINIEYDNVQTSKYVTRVLCAEPECKVALYFNAPGGEDDDSEFRVDSCKCEDHTILCCKEHVDTHVCQNCKE